VPQPEAIMDDWFDTNYGFRRLLSIIPPTLDVIEEGWPLTVMIEKDLWHSMNKLRIDDLDVRIVYIDPDIAATPVQIAIPHKLVYPTDEEHMMMLHVVFNAEKEIMALEATPSMNMDYYLYYSNPKLVNHATLPFSDSDFIIELTPDNYNYSLTFSRPNEHWIGGTSDKINAKFNLHFYGVNVMLTMMTGPDRGIVEIILDEQEPLYIDTYNAIDLEQVVYMTSHDLSPDFHDISCRVTGDKNPTSGSYSLEFVSFSYSIFVEAMQGSEEVLTTSSTNNFLLGA
jgi:hypothetical protein